jgi:hypothetical protein
VRAACVLAVLVACAAPAGPGAGPGAPADAAPAVVDAGPPGGGDGDGGGGGAPWHPAHLALGTIYEGDSGADAFFDAVRPTFPAGAFLEYGYLYLNGGDPMGEWPERVPRLVRGCRRHGMVPVFVLYGMNGGSDSAGALAANLADPAYVAAYFAALEEALAAARAEAGDGAPIGWIIEPDMLGSLQQQVAPAHGGDPALVPAATHAVYDAGVLVHGVDPELPDTLPGFVAAVNHAIRRHGGAGTFLGWQLNLWGAPGGGARGIVHATEELGWDAGRAKLRANAAALADFARRAGIGAAGADFVSIDKYGLDGAGAAGADPAHPADSVWFWNADLWSNYLAFVATLHDELDLPVVLWQIPVGRINVSLHPGGFAPLDNTLQRYEDSASTYFFGDRFETVGARLAYFAGNAAQDPEVSVAGGVVTWGAHLDEAAAAGVVVVLFGAGVGASTRGVPQPSGPTPGEPTDGGYWITRVAEYYAAPVPL